MTKTFCLLCFSVFVAALHGCHGVFNFFLVCVSVLWRPYGVVLFSLFVRLSQVLKARSQKDGRQKCRLQGPSAAK